MAHMNYVNSVAHQKYIFFADLTKIGIILIQSHWTAIVNLAVVIFKFETKRKRSMPLNK